MACVIQPLPVRLSAAPCASQGSSQPSSQAATPLYLSPHRRCCVVFVPSSAHGPSLLPPLSLSLGGAPCCAPSISAPFSSSGVFNITTWQADHLSPPPPPCLLPPSLAHTASSQLCTTCLSALPTIVPASKMIPLSHYSSQPSSYALPPPQAKKTADSAAPVFFVPSPFLSVQQSHPHPAPISRAV